MPHAFVCLEGAFVRRNVRLERASVCEGTTVWRGPPSIDGAFIVLAWFHKSSFLIWLLVNTNLCLWVPNKLMVTPRFGAGLPSCSARLDGHRTVLHHRTVLYRLHMDGWPGMVCDGVPVAYDVSLPLCSYNNTRTLTLEPHTACRKGGWGLAKIN